MKNKTRNLIYYSCIIGIVLAAIILMGMKYNFFSFVATSLPGTVVSYTTISQFDGTFIHIPFSGSLSDATTSDKMLIYIQDGTNRTSKDTCDKIGWIWDSSDSKCNPTDGLKNFNYNFSSICAGSLCPSAIISNVKFDGRYIQVSGCQCPNYLGPSLGTLSCNGEVLININQAPIPPPEDPKPDYTGLWIVGFIILVVLILSIVYIKFNRRIK